MSGLRVFLIGVLTSVTFFAFWHVVFNSSPSDPQKEQTLLKKLTPKSPPSPKPPLAFPSRSVAQTTKESTWRGWKLRRSNNNKNLTLLGNRFRLRDNNLNEVIRFLEPLLHDQGLDPKELHKGNVSDTHTPRTQTYRFKQRISGYEVFGSQLSVSVKKEGPSGGSVFMVTSNLEKHKEEDILLGLSLTETQAKEVLASQPAYKDHTFTLSTPALVLFPLDSGDLVLSYYFRSSTNPKAQKFDRRIFMVSATDGRILLDQSSLLH